MSYLQTMFKYLLINIVVFFSLFQSLLAEPPKAFFESKESIENTFRKHLYTISINQALSRAQVKICFSGKAPNYLVVDYKDALKTLIDFPTVTKGAIEFQGRYWQTSGLESDACIEYQADISEHLNKKIEQDKNELQISFQSHNNWLWLPENLSRAEKVELNFELPRHFNISAPWKMLDSKGRVFELGYAPHDWGFSLMIGEFDLESISMADNKKINIAVLQQIENKKDLIQWVKSSALSLENYLGFFPIENLQLMLLKNSRYKNGPVPWGDVKRGGNPAIRFLVNTCEPIEKYYIDWTATHEFAHLLLPKIEYSDIWLSEGLASYLQYVFMGQAKQLTPQQTWQKLVDGFYRGQRHAEKAPKESLKNAVVKRKRGGPAGRTKRFYWSGAIYFFSLDLQLRKESNNQLTLAQVLAEFNRCCNDYNREWSGSKLTHVLDDISKKKLFFPLYEKMASDKNYPAFEHLLKDAGIELIERQVSFNKKQPAYYQEILHPINNKK